MVIKKSRLARTTLLLESSFGTVAEVLALKKVVDWIHFVPLTVDLASPIDAATLLHCHGLAFLSACQATTGDKQHGGLGNLKGCMFVRVGAAPGSKRQQNTASITLSFRSVGPESSQMHLTICSVNQHAC